jgi:hypothetical protein
MEESIRVAVGVISRTRVAVVLVILGLLLPAQLLAAVSPATAVVGAVLGLVAPVTLLVIFLTDLEKDRHYTIPSIVGGLLRAFGALLIAYLLAVALILPIIVVATLFAVVLANGGAISSSQIDPVRGGIIVASLLAIAGFFSPLLLVLPVCLVEHDGPWRALKRTWALSRPRRNSVRVVVVALVAVTVAIGLIRSVGGVGPLAAAVTLSVVILVVDAALVAVLYETLVVDSPPGRALLLAVPVAVRSRELAAAGTFRESTHRSSKSRRRRR